MKLEWIAMVRYLARALAHLARGTARRPSGHGDLEHAHWDRAQRQWVTHEEHLQEAA